jgi:hypothetical protein
MSRRLTPGDCLRTTELSAFVSNDTASGAITSVDKLMKEIAARVDVGNVPEGIELIVEVPRAEQGVCY